MIKLNLPELIMCKLLTEQSMHIGIATTDATSARSGFSTFLAFLYGQYLSYRTGLLF